MGGKLIFTRLRNGLEMPKYNILQAAAFRLVMLAWMPQPVTTLQDSATFLKTNHPPRGEPDPIRAKVAPPLLPVRARRHMG